MVRSSMAYPKSVSEFKKFAGTWTDVELKLDFPEGTSLIIGREDLVGPIPVNCSVCTGITYLTFRDEPVLKAGAAPICSRCYLNALKEK
jgi:hypothetical protein